MSTVSIYNHAFRTDEEVSKNVPTTIEAFAERVKDRTGAEFIIFAAQPFSVEEVLVFCQSNKINVKVMLGNYKGEREISFMVPFNALVALVDSDLLCKQESIMLLSNEQQGGNRLGYLLYAEVDLEQEAGIRIDYKGEIGTIDAAFLPDSYTYDPGSSLYYGVTVKPSEG